MKPKEFYLLTEVEYYKICIGYKQKEINKLRLHRDLTYTIYCGYADPKKRTPIQKFMPLPGDIIHVVERPSNEKLKQYIKQFGNSGNPKKLSRK